MNVVERVVGKCPGLGGVLKLELAVRRDPRRLSRREISAYDRRTREFVGEVAACVLVLCIDGLGMGSSGETHMAHMPVPVPISSTDCGFFSGAAKSLLSRARYSTWWLMSSPSFCASSFGPQYSALPKLWYVLPCSLRYSRIVELIDAVDVTLGQVGERNVLGKISAFVDRRAYLSAKNESLSSLSKRGSYSRHGSSGTCLLRRRYAPIGSHHLDTLLIWRRAGVRFGARHGCGWPLSMSCLETKSCWFCCGVGGLGPPSL